MFHRLIDRSGETFRSNLLLFAMVLAVVGFGLNVLLASSSFLARQEYGDPYFYLKKQALFAIIGFILMIALSQFPYRRWETFAWPIYFISLLLLLLVFVPGIGKKAGGAYRWLNLGGISLQPSDIARFSVILLLARLFSKWKEISWANISLVLIIIGTPAFLIAIEQDLSTALHLLLSAIALLFFTAFPLRVHVLMGAVSLPLLYFMVFHTPFRMERLKAFLDPWTYRFEAAYQLVASFKSFIAGGWFGQGLGEGLRRHNLQARHTDFILAIVAEDTGVFGTILLLALYMGIAIYGLFLMSRLENQFARLLGSGIILVFVSQVILNVAVTMGVVPTTGINLPLLSYGGTSLVMYMCMFGIILNITRLEK